ncbi:MAG: right-handed parallel beta-helix repeat-containing protein [Acidimicrobiia bacterium]|nr:right-handed parallel beta-helix repeat-containing protein [Acidimicrobiia bacterium]
MSDLDQHSSRKGKYIAVAVIAAASLAIAPWLLINGDGGDVPPTTEAAPPTTQSVPPTITSSSTTSTTTPTAITTALSPFADPTLLSRDRPVPPLSEIPNAAAEIYVDPDGNDSGAGTLQDPVATLEAAQQLARPHLRDGAGDVVVYLRGGVHLRTEPLVLGFQDSGRAENRMVYRSYPDEQAIVEGGVRIDTWRPAFDNVLVADVPLEVEDVRQFFAAGSRQQRAKAEVASNTANRFVKGPLFDAQRNVTVAVDASLVEEFAHPEDLELVYVGVNVSGHGITRASGSEILRPSWKAHRLPVESAVPLPSGEVGLKISNGALYHASERGHEPMEILPSDPFYFENALELLDEPGEWYFDSRERQIYWWAPDTEATEDAWLAVTEVLLAIDGTLERPVRNVSIEGIAFRHAGYPRTNDEGYVVSQAAAWFTSWKTPGWMTEGPVQHSFTDRSRPSAFPGAAVEIDSARDVEFVGNVFTELGAIGVLLSNDVRRISFDRNLFVDISAEALVAGHPEHEIIDEPTEGPIGDIVFKNNVIDRAGAEFFASVGLMITKAEDAAIHNNLFRDLPYSAISLGWGWANNLEADFHRAINVEDNYFENVVNTLYDGAPIYLVGPVAEYSAARRDFTHIRGNFANNLDADEQFKAPTDLINPGFAKRPGVQLDQGVRNTLISNNVFTGSTSWLQVTAWQDNRDVPGWIESMALTGTGNWSDTDESVPDNTALAGIGAVSVFPIDDLPPEVVEIVQSAGLEPGVALPPLP